MPKKSEIKLKNVSITKQQRSQHERSRYNMTYRNYKQKKYVCFIHSLLKIRSDDDA